MATSAFPRLSLSKETVRQYALRSPNGDDNTSFSGECTPTCSTLQCESLGTGCEPPASTGTTCSAGGTCPGDSNRCERC